MAQDGYRSIRLKEAVVGAIEDYISKHPEQGYKSIAEFVTDAIRTKLNELSAREAGTE